MKLLSDQVSEKEVQIILQQLQKVLEGGVPGDVVEFGCYVGTTSVFLQQKLMNFKKQLHVYDSFEGLPEKVDFDFSPVGEQFKKGELFASKNEFVKNFKKQNLPLPIIHKGWFSELTSNDVPGCISFAYLDGDYYHSIIDPLKLIWKNLSSGTIVVVDDYQNEQLPGVKKALDVWAQAHSFSVKIQESLAILSVR